MLSPARRAGSALAAARSVVVLHSTDAGHGLPVGARARANVAAVGHRARALRGAGARPHARHAPDALRRAARARPRRLCRVHADDRRPRAPPARADDLGQRHLVAARGVAHGVHCRRRERRSRSAARHSRETSSPTVPVARPSGFAWPPARGSRRPRASARASFRSSRWRAGSSGAVLADAGSAASTGGCRSTPGWAARSRAMAQRAAHRRAPPTLARRLRAGDRDRHALVDGLDGPRGARSARGRARMRSSISTARPATSSRTTSSRPSGSEPSAALLPTLDPTTMGWKERDWYLGEHASLLFDSNGNAGPTVWWDGRVVGGWSQRRDGEIVFRAARGRGPRGGRRRWKPRRRASPPGSATSASRPASCRRSSAGWRPSPRPSGGRSPSRSRAAGSATCPRRSGRASRRA